VATAIASSRFMYFQVTSDRRFNYTTVVWQVSPSLHGYVCNVDMIKLPQVRHMLFGLCLHADYSIPAEVTMEGVKVLADAST